MVHRPVNSSSVPQMDNIQTWRRNKFKNSYSDVGTGASVITLDSITGINTGDTYPCIFAGAGRTTVHSYNTGAKTVSIDGVTTAVVATATQIVVTLRLIPMMIVVFHFNTM